MISPQTISITCRARVAFRNPSNFRESEPQLPCRQVAHDLFRAAANRHDAHLTIDAFHTVAADEPGAAKDLHGLAGAEFHRLGRLHLQHGKFTDRLFAALNAPCQLVEHRRRGPDTLAHGGNLVADDLVVREALAEGLALLGPGRGFLDADAGIGGRLRGHAEALAIELKQRIEAGEDFGDLARQYSDDIGSAAEGGELGWTNPGQMVPEFEAAMAGTSEGAISEPVRSEFGWHILQVEARRDKDFSSEMQRNQVAGYIREQKYQEELEAWLRKIREEAFVDIK